MPSISAVIITLNEERDIARALASVSWCDEIVVVDSGSSDRTVQICREFGCKVIAKPFNGYGEQKRFAVSQASHDWILSIDADEVISHELREEIATELNSAESGYNGFYLPISTILWDRVKRCEKRHTRPKLRLFNRRHGSFGLQKVHESVELTGQTKHLKERMFNYAYSNVADYFHKFNLYTSAAAEESFMAGKNASGIQIIARFPWEFLKLFFIKGFCADGVTGFVWSLFSALYPVVKYIKLYELCRTERESSPLSPTYLPDRPAIFGGKGLPAGFDVERGVSLETK